MMESLIYWLFSPDYKTEVFDVFFQYWRRRRHGGNDDNGGFDLQMARINRGGTDG